MAPIDHLNPLPLFTLVIPRGTLAAASGDITRKGVSNESQINSSAYLSDSQMAILQAASLTISTVSLLAGFFTFYWFMRMRRSFRHDLIMLLIIVDMWKAVWYIAFPIVEFFKGRPVQSDSAFCQASGFFLAIGTEACDVVILMIAVHTALYIFRSRHSECGLYPYRKPAYATLIFLPIIMASLAFAGGSGYVNVGEHCYLPIRPDVYRLALSWVPRYFIFIVILVIYASLYIYVRMLMGRYSKASGGTANTNLSRPISLKSERFNRFDTKRAVPQPPTPPTVYRRSISLPGSRSGSARQMGRTPATDLESPPRGVQNKATATATRNSMLWKWPTHIDIDTESRPHPLTSNPTFPLVPEPNSPASPTSATPTYTTPPRPAYTPGASDPDSPTDLNSSPTSWIRRSPTSNTSTTYNPLLKVISLATSGRRRSSCPLRTPLSASTSDPHPSRRRTSSGSTIPDCSFSLSDGALPIDGMTDARDKVSRQLRMLFVYPVVYMVMWVIPFISHMLSYSSRFVHPQHQPFPLLVFSLISLTGQGAVDCWLFASRERPWRHSRKGFWEAVGKKLTLPRRRMVENGGVKKGVGRSKEEMLVDGRNARLRRDEEIAERRLDGGRAGGTGKGRERGVVEERSRNREWWEVGVGGGPTRWSQMPVASKPSGR